MIMSGHGLVLQHFRRNEECGVLEEFEPIDINLKYDFNYQVKGCCNLHIHPSIDGYLRFTYNNDLLSHMFSKLTSYQEKSRYCQ